MRPTFAIMLVLVALQQVALSSDAQQVLSNYVGEWAYAYDSDTPPLADGKFVGRRILGGKFVELDGEFTAIRVPNDVSIKILMTYDDSDKAYRRWTFVSNGRVLVASGTWDPKTRTMEWVTDYDEPLSGRRINYTTTETFTGDGVFEWKTVSRDTTDEVVDQSNGTATRAGG